MKIPINWLIQRAQVRMANLKACIAAQQYDLAIHQLGMIAGIIVSIEEFSDENKIPESNEIDQIRREWRQIRRELADK